MAFQDNAGKIYFCGRTDDETKINGYIGELNKLFEEEKKSNIDIKTALGRLHYDI